ncbi:spore maturation protein B [Caldanaerobius fijiensis DSM 17918]|uniref:Spore maturation protein B n=1 Tax=Caldanaerobius fijiensis DSM 17918 TaxID=1121256 RepID=A0A1M4X1M1_9THEO|nr:nucleoside recognition domain-containing protein [Caldanaerobius fijiensis]SHE87401.1 spore maturation protein B [Caldanaerobius fijiensis DSM 17918]
MYVFQILSRWAVPFILSIIFFIGFIKKMPLYEIFIDGAREGFDTVIKIIPPLVAMFVAIGMFRASGAMDMIVKALSPITSIIGMPAELLPLALMRPLSGGASLGIVSDLLKNYGPDTIIGKMASIMYGSTETTIYVLTVYFGSIGIKNVRHALIAGLLTDLCSMVFAVLITHLISN